MLSVPKKPKEDSERNSATIVTLTLGGFLVKYWYFTQDIYPEILKYPK